MFITEEDYRVVIGENALKVVSQASGEIRDNAELEACEEIAGYLRPKYDTEAVFSAEGEERNRLVVMLNWTWAYWTYQRAARIILGKDPEAGR